MADLYVESVVIRKPIPGGKILKKLFAALAIFFFLFGISWSFLLLIPAVLFGLGFLWAYSNVDLEFEYLHMGNSLDIDKIVANSRRKNVVSIDLSRVIVVAPQGSSTLAPYTHFKTVDYSSREPSVRPYVMVCSMNGVKKNIVLQLNEKMQTSLKRQLRGKFEE